MRIERRFRQHFSAFAGERHVDHADAVAAAGVETDGILYQTRKASEIRRAPRSTGDFAIGRVGLDHVIDHYRDRKAGQTALLLLGVTDRTVQLEVLGRLHALVGRVWRQRRLAGCRVHDLLTIGIEQGLAWSDRAGCTGCTTACSLRSRRRAGRLIAQRPRNAARA